MICLDRQKLEAAGHLWTENTEPLPQAIWNALQRGGDGLATVVGETAAERNVRVRVGNRFMPCVAEAAAPAARRRRQRLSRCLLGRSTGWSGTTGIRSTSGNMKET